MKKILVMLLEYGFIIAAMLPRCLRGLSSRRGIDLQRQPTPSIPRLVQGTEPWDKKSQAPHAKRPDCALHDGRQVNVKTTSFPALRHSNGKNTTGKPQQDFHPSLS